MATKLPLPGKAVWLPVELQLLTMTNDTERSTNDSGPSLMNRPSLTEHEFNKFSKLIYSVCGINMTPAKRIMLSSRLNRRLRKLSINTFKEYFEYVMSPEGQRQEMVFLLNEVSTNKTDFFREPDHFSFLTAHILPRYLSLLQQDGQRPLKVWSAGCSSGEEPYTIAMVLAEFQAAHPRFDFSILATDISTAMLQFAQKAVYPDDRLETMDIRYKHKYLMRGTMGNKGAHRVVPELRGKVEFRRLNFLDNDFGIKELSDVIFCRNVIIYFDRETQYNLFQKFYRQLAPGGFLMIGHSETLIGMEDKLQRLAPAVYQCLK